MEPQGSMGVHSIWCLGNRRREMRNLTVRPWSRTAALALFAAGAAVPLQAPAAWEPTKTVEFIVPAGTGGGADQLARPDAGADDGPGQFRSLGQRRDALQDN